MRVFQRSSGNAGLLIWLAVFLLLAIVIGDGMHNKSDSTKSIHEIRADRIDAALEEAS